MSTLFTIPDPVEIAYRRAISAIVKSWLPTKLTGMSDSYWLRELASVSSRRSVVSASTDVAMKMFSRINVMNLKDWKEAAVTSQRSRIIHDLLQQELSGRIGIRVRDLIEASAQNISDIPREVAEKLSLEIAQAERQGTRPQAIAQILKFRFPQLVNTKIQLLARTQTSSANTALTRARSEELDIPCFQWWTAQDGRRVRPSHRNMQAVVVFWSDLPSPEALIGLKPSLGHYAAGDCPYCRCNSLPTLSVEDVLDKKSGLIKVYYQSSIRQMTKSQFTQVSGIESRLAA